MVTLSAKIKIMKLTLSKDMTKSLCYFSLFSLFWKI